MRRLLQLILLVGFAVSFAASESMFEELPKEDAHSHLYQQYSNYISEICEGQFEFSVTLFNSRFYVPHSELMNEFLEIIKAHIALSDWADRSIGWFILNPEDFEGVEDV